MELRSETPHLSPAPAKTSPMKRWVELGARIPILVKVALPSSRDYAIEITVRSRTQETKKRCTSVDSLEPINRRSPAVKDPTV